MELQLGIVEVIVTLVRLVDVVNGSRCVGHHYIQILVVAVGIPEGICATIKEHRRADLSVLSYVDELFALLQHLASTPDDDIL